MRIATKTGDNGKTGRLFGTRVSKTSPAIQTVGDIDELNAAIGLIKAHIPYGCAVFWYHSILEKIQHALTLFMGEVAAEETKREEYLSKYDYIKEEDMDWLESELDKLQNMKELDQQGWILYGNSVPGAFADMSSKVCRRAERSLLLLMEQESLIRPSLCKYLNRLSDFLHMLARRFDLKE